MKFYENLESLKKLPDNANEGDFCKYNGQPYVYAKGQWITLHEAARMIVSEQRENL
jgi:hypothetical protein